MPPTLLYWPTLEAGVVYDMAVEVELSCLKRVNLVVYNRYQQRSSLAK
jgi:hypothetical protein